MYYILYNDDRLGPFDSVSMLRKVRNGTVTRNTLIVSGMNEGSAALPAEEIDEILVFIKEYEESLEQELYNHSINLHFITLWKNGINFFDQHSQSVLYSGLILCIAVLVALIFSISLDFKTGMITGYLASFLVYYSLYYIYCTCILRLSRGQVLDKAYFEHRVAPQLGRIIPAALLIAFLILIFGTLAIIPGVLIATLFIFVPFLIADQEMEVKEAMHVSYRKVIKIGVDNFVVIFLFTLINILSFLLFIPLFFTLPLYVNAMSEVYDRVFYQC